MQSAYNIADLRSLARKRLPRGLFEYVDRGSEDELALANNRAALQRIRLRPRVLRDVSVRKLDTTLFGRPMAMPIAISPTAVAGMLWHDGEVHAARAAAAAGIPFALSTASVTSIEHVAKNASGRIWFQLYVFGNRDHMRELIGRAKAAGCEALVLTVDTAVNAKREYNQRNGFGVPIEYNARTIFDVLTHPRWACGVLARYVLTTGMPRMAHYPKGQSIGSRVWNNANKLDASLSWEDVKEIRSLWPGKLLIKGVLAPEDAMLAVEHGADGVVVSNHGGRNLDSALATIDALPDVLDAVAQRVPVLIDGAFTRGADVVKALAMGAACVMVGRANLWGVASAGESGASRALGILREEMDRVLGQVGCARIDQLGPELLFPPYADGLRRETSIDARSAGRDDARSAGTGRMRDVSERSA
jgi:isopentenyl diphosphate isomerase/L-lactate dehydrogenase-like FMN-dependent dehydrogenase